jgi:hypothetical protein
MKTLITVLIALLASAGLVYHFTDTDTYTGSPFLYTCATGRTPPGLDYGWSVNGTLMLIST